MNFGLKIALLLLTQFFEPNENLQIKSDDFFDNSDIITQNITFVSQALKFGPTGIPFYDLAPALLLNYADIEYLKNIPGSQLTSHFKCSSLPLDKSQTYSIMKPLSTNPNGIIDFSDLKLPFTNILAQYINFVGKKYCIAFNKRNYGFGFDALTSVPCMSNKMCGASLYGISVSTEGKLIDNSLENVVIFDGMRKQQIPLQNHFAMQLYLAFPTKEPTINSQQAIFFPFESSSDGFNFKLSTNLNIYAQFHRENFFYFRTNEFEMDLFYNDGHLFSVSGALRDTITNVLSTCFPSGIFINARIELDSLRIFSLELAGLLGKNMLNLEGNVDVGYYIDFRKSQKNGFFIRGDVRINLFHLFKLKIYVEVTKINRIELKRRIDSMHSSSLCPEYEITVVAKYIFDKFNYAAAASKYQLYNPYKMKNSEEWDRFVSLGSSSTTFYFVGYLKAKTRIIFPLVFGIIDIRGYLEGFFVLPNPFKKGLKLHMELEIEATIYGFGVDLSWEVNDQETTWYCFAELFLVDIGIVLKGPSTWLEEKGFGSLLKIPKKFEKFSIRFGNSIKRLLQELNKYLKKIAEQLKEMWDGIKRAVENLHREIKNLTDKLCNCFVSDIAAGLLTVISAGWVAAGQLLLSLFGNTKTETRKIGETDPFKCDILEVKVKKCICAFGKCACTTIRTDKTVDQACINRVQAIHLEAAYKEEIANWKEDVVTVNMGENLGYQYILEQIGKNNLDFFTGEDIQLGDIIYEFPDLPKYASFTSKFDPNNQSFVQDFENSFASLFPPISNIDEDLDLSQLYQNDQDLLIKTQLVINTARLSSLFRGKDAEIFNLSLPLELDFKSGDLLEESFDKMFETLTDPNGELFKMIVGNNSGITEILLEAYGMTPPVISIKNKVNKTIHCDDPQIDDVYDQGEYKITQRLKYFLTIITLEDIYKTCMSNITYIDNVECSIDKDVCGATNCLFERYIVDGCKQKSNNVYESIKILPRKPFFEEFPDNIPVKCDENINVTSTINRFKQPKVNPGCRGLEYNLFYEDVRDEKKCEQKIYRKWHAETLDCEAELFALRVQQLYVEDRVAPYFSYFPADRNVEFFEAYGTRDLDYPRAYDSCGHGPSLITYNDTAIKTTSGKRVIERTWSVVDFCGNKRDKIQKIYFQNSRDNSQWDFRRYLTFSFGQLNLTNVNLMGEVGGRDKVKLNNSQIGHFGGKCSNLKFMLTSSDHIDLDDSIINGPVKTLNRLRNDFNFDESWRQAKNFSAFLNLTVFQINKGFNKIKCIENTPSLNEDYPIQNFNDSTCVGQESKKMYTNVIEHADELVLDCLDRVLLKGNELIYNIFYFRDISLISNRILAIDVPIDSFAIINIDAHQVKLLNISKIEFVNEKMNPTNVLFNFLIADEIVYNDDCLNEIVGSILAPYAIFEIKGGNLEKKKTLNGQLFAKSLNATNFSQYCDLFELFF